MATVSELEPDSRVGMKPLSVWATSTLCVTATFGVYFFTYFFRVAFTAAGNGDFQNAGAAASYLGIDYKAILVIAQVLGYMIAKFVGIKVVAEMSPSRRALAVIALIAVAQCGLMAFAVVPAPWNAACLFVNGLPLGLVFGLVLGFVEGRQVTEILTAGLCASFIVAAGAAKGLGSLLVKLGCNVFWMPAVAGLIAAPPLLLFVYLLTRIPPPTADDVVERSRRAPMNAADRWRCFVKYAPGLVALMFVYLLMTVLRQMRSDFANEIWKGLGRAAAPNDFVWPEMIVAFLATLANGLCFLIRDNRRAFYAAIGISLAGMLIIVLAVAGWQTHLVSDVVFMCLVGTGLYLPYVATHTTIFERLIAITRDRANLGYLMYLADAYGYLGYVAVVITKNVFNPRGDFLQLFLNAAWILAAISAATLVFAAVYFQRRTHPFTSPAAGES